MTTKTLASITITDAITMAVSRLVDDAQTDEKREPSHSHLDDLIARCKVTAGDPKGLGKTVGKAKRVRGVLNHAMENDPEAGSRFVLGLIGVLKGCGSFRETSVNYSGADAIANAVAAFNSEGYDLSLDGEVRPLLLENLSGTALVSALHAYVRRAKKGAADAALVTGTGKDLLEATARHVLMVKRGTYPAHDNFPTVLGLAFTELGLATARSPGQTALQRVEAALYELGCAVNQLRNSEGTGHGRPFPSSVTEAEARSAIEAMGTISERLLACL
jgi:abortive infection Abi-like protein